MPCDAIQCHLTPFQKMPQIISSYQKLFLTCWCMFWRSLLVIEPFFTYLWLPTYIPFLPHFLLTSCGPAHPLLCLITNLQIAINCCIIDLGALREGILTVSSMLSILCVFFHRCLYQAMHVSVSQTFIYT